MSISDGPKTSEVQLPEERIMTHMLLIGEITEITLVRDPRDVPSGSKID